MIGSFLLIHAEFFMPLLSYRPVEILAAPLSYIRTQMTTNDAKMLWLGISSQVERKRQQANAVHGQEDIMTICSRALRIEGGYWTLTPFSSNRFNIYAKAHLFITWSCAHRKY